MPTLVVAEHDNYTLAAATRHAVTAAGHLGDEVHLLVAGSGAQPVVDAAAAVAGVARVLHADAPHYAHGLPEQHAPLIVGLVREGGYKAVMAAATAAGKNLMPRVAALLDAPQLSDITAVVAKDTFVRPIYAGNVLATVRCSEPLLVITVRTTAFDAALDAPSPVAVESVESAPASELATFVGQALSESSRPELTSARVVVSGGRGLGSRDNFALVEGLADAMGAAVGASRAAVDAGYVPNDYQVGQTGKVVAPELYVAVAISGAIQHLAGMKDSKVIVAINKDDEAPIFQVADYGLVGDLFTLLPEFTKTVEAERGE